MKIKINTVHHKTKKYFAYASYASLVFILMPFSMIYSHTTHRKESLNNNDYGLMSTIPTDEDYPYCWHLSTIEAEKAWDITTGSHGISVNIIDSGINYNQDSLQQFTELDNNVNAEDSIEVCSNSTEGPFFDFASYLSLNGHGTRVASLIGAEANNGEGGCGIAWDVDMLSIKSSCANSGIDFSEIKTVFDSSNDNYRGCVPITNMSIGITVSNNYQYNYYNCGDLLSSLNTYNGLIVVAAGNESRNLDTTTDKVYPACFDLANTIVVGASTISDEKLSNSNFGQNTVDLFAPGDGLWTPGFSVDYTGNQVFLGMNDDFSGTSAAAPLVAGTAALMLSVNPNLTTYELKSLIMNNVDQIPSLSDKCVSGGRLNTYKAVKAAIPGITTFGTFANGIQSLPSNKHQFYKVSLTPGLYHFESSSNLDMSGYLYSDIQNSPIAQSDNSSGDFSFDYFTNINKTVYLKITNNSNSDGNYSYKVTKTSNHYHSYDNEYVWFNSTKHRAMCSCGMSSLQGHVVSSNNTHLCLLCNGYASMGFIIQSTNPYIEVGNDSRLLNNGMIILGDIDYNLFINNELDINSLYLGESI